MAKMELELTSNDLLIVNGIEVTVSDGILEVKNSTNHFGLKCDRVVNDIKVPQVTEFTGLPSSVFDVTKVKQFIIDGNLNEVMEKVREYRKEAKSRGYRCRVYPRNKNRKSLLGKVFCQTGHKYSHDSLRRYVPIQFADRVCIYCYTKETPSIGTGCVSSLKN